MEVKKIFAYKCPKCGCAYTDRSAAERCCKPKHCDRCGKEIPKNSYYCLCEDCRKQLEIEEEQRRFDKAVKYKFSECPSDKKEKMFSEMYGYDDGYFDEIGDLIEYCEDRGIEIPKYCWGTELKMISFDASDLIEIGCEDLHENASESIDNAAADELQRLLDEWCEKQYGTATYYVDYTCAILLDDQPCSY